MLCPTMMRGIVGSPSGIRWRSDLDSPSSQGDIQPYQAVGLTAQAMQANDVSLYMTSVSKVSMLSLGASTFSVDPSLLYLVHPLCRTHFRGFGGGFAQASFFDMLRYGSAASMPSL
jgi:hypothetical protein